MKKQKSKEFWKTIVSGEGNVQLAKTYAARNAISDLAVSYTKAIKRRRLGYKALILGVWIWLGIPGIIFALGKEVTYAQPTTSWGILIGALVAITGMILLGSSDPYNLREFENVAKKFLELFNSGEAEPYHSPYDLAQYTWNKLRQQVSEIDSYDPFKEVSARAQREEYLKLNAMIAAAKRVGILPDDYVDNTVCYDHLFIRDFGPRLMTNPMFEIV